jgi:hypothetical protein
MRKINSLITNNLCHFIYDIIFNGYPWSIMFMLKMTNNTSLKHFKKRKFNKFLKKKIKIYNTIYKNLDMYDEAHTSSS